MSMNEPHTTVSVRGEARRLVRPDRCVVRCAVSWLADDAAGARAGLARETTALREALLASGAVVATPDTARAPLTLAAGAAHTAEFWVDEGNDGHRTRQRATVTVVVSVRELDRLGGVLATVTGRDAVAVSTAWDVDEDNPAWREVRAEAVHVALQRGRDYAAALGGQVLAVDQIADAGLLGGDSHNGPAVAFGAVRAAAAGASAFSDDPPDEVSLDPVPQELSAVLEARLIAVLPPLPPA